MEDTVRLNYYTSNHTFNVEFKYFKPDAAERRIVKASTPIEFRFIVINGIFYLMLKTDEINVVDMPFSPAIYPQGKFKLDEIAESKGLALTISMFDTSNNRSVGHRLIGLDHDFSIKMRDALLNENYVAAAMYNISIKNTYTRYTTGEMWIMAKASCRIGNTESNVAINDTAPDAKQNSPIRRSLRDIAAYVILDKPYPNLPDELKPYHAWITDSGHTIQCIPNSLIAKAKADGEYWKYEVPIPVKYVLTHPYEINDGYIYIDAPYDNSLGVDIDEKYWEF